MQTERKNIIWLASYPKSGNTWMRILFENLMSDSSEPVDINNLDLTLISSSREVFDQYSGINSSELSNSEIHNLRPKVYRILSKESDDLLFIKVHDAWQITNEGDELFPKEITKGVLYLIRNPLDIAVSYSFHKSISIDEAIHILNDSNHSLASSEKKIFNQLEQRLFNWSEHVESWIEKSNHNILVLKYEDLLSNTFHALKEICGFFNIPYTEAELEVAIKNSSIESLQAQEMKSGFREKPQSNELFFREGKSNIWPKYFSTQNLSTLKSFHNNIMRKFDYL